MISTPLTWKLLYNQFVFQYFFRRPFQFLPIIMGLLTTNHFCYCLSLRTGGLICGYIGILFATLGIIGAIFMQSAPCVQINGMYDAVIMTWNRSTKMIQWILLCSALFATFNLPVVWHSRSKQNIFEANFTNLLIFTFLISFVSFYFLGFL